MKPVLITVGVLVAAFFAIGAINASTPEGQARTHEREVIAQCRGQQDRGSLSPGALSSVASVCEKLEAEYRAKWNREP